jgi:hypothetical protein
MLFLILPLILFAFVASALTTPSDKYPNNVFCYNCGDGVDRLDAGIAAEAICNYWYGRKMYVDDPHSQGGFAYN